MADIREDVKQLLGAYTEDAYATGVFDARGGYGRELRDTEELDSYEKLLESLTPAEAYYEVRYGSRIVASFNTLDEAAEYTHESQFPEDFPIYRVEWHRIPYVA